jgi:uncharacterized protein (DUF1800 family)
MTRNRAGATLASILLVLSPAVGLTGIKKIKPNANPPQYVAFSKPSPKTEQYHHALDRLTFGPRPGDLGRIERIGLQKWLDLQLNPEKVPEASILDERLEPLKSLRMSIRDTYVQYPSRQLIVAVASGRAPLPEDPELRAIVAQLADRYLKKREANAQPGPSLQQASQSSAKDLNTPGRESKVRLSDVLTPDQIDILRNGEPQQKQQLLASLPAAKRLDFVWVLRPERRQLFIVAPVALRRELMLSMSPQNVVANDLTEAKLLRATYSNHQLQELLVDFWYNHFNVFIGKGRERYLVPSYEPDAIRPYVLGSFYDLLLQTAKSPAMLFYLDNWQSVADGTAGRVRRAANQKAKRGLNENYGRELLELHTLGVDGGYTQKDVIDVARCFTGWTIANAPKGSGFEYNDKVHDKGQKIVLGHVIRAGGGMDDGLRVLDILAHHPATAHFVSLKLAQRFVTDNPPPSLVNRMAEVFRKTDGDLRQVTRTMLTGPEFWSEGAYRAKVKSPFEMIVSAVRATDANVESAFLLSAEPQRLGEPLYRKMEPTGYSSANAEWVSSAGLLERMNFGLALAHNRVPGVKVDTLQWQALTQKDPMELARLILEQNPSDQTTAAIQNALNDERLQKELVANADAGPPQVLSLVAGLTLGSPEFQRR